MNASSRFILERKLFFFLLIISFAMPSESAPWRLSKQPNFPSWLSIAFEHRTRYETLDGQYRSRVNSVEGNGGDQALVFRTLAHAIIDLQSIRFGVELMDSRIALTDAGSASGSKGLTTTIANPIELLQAYVEFPFNNLLLNGSQALIRAGRITIDMGSRRLIARNRYRNTINAFNGIDVQWQHQAQQIRAFYTLPIQRRVKGDIADNRVRFDAEHPEVRFWGIYYKQAVFSEQNLAELFLLGLDENDTQGRPTKHRELYTFGVRLWRESEINRFDYQLETVFQTGNSRTSNASHETLQHNAHFHHVELGYSFDLPWSPRLLVQYDYASGDDNPNDNHNNRFDTLYGARRFDFGPTSIYGAFARSNINSPGIRITLKPNTKISTMFSVRGFWRASITDTWTTAGINESNPYIGTQIEGRLRWDILPGNMRMETGFVHLISGDLMNAVNRNDVTYGYFQAAIKF